MATITKTASGTWKAIIRKRGWPTSAKTFRTKRDAQDWGRRTEDEMVRGVHIDRGAAERLTLKAALKRYLAEVTPRKKPSTQARERRCASELDKVLGDYSLAAISPEMVARYRDDRLNNVSATSTRLELALLSHLYNNAIREWGAGLPRNPVSAIKKPAPHPGRNRRLKLATKAGQDGEEERLLAACRSYSNPMLSWMVRLALATCMRIGELQTLCRDQVDLHRRVIRLTETKNGSSRTVPLSREAAILLHEALNHPACPIDTDLVFWGEPGKDGKRRPYQLRSAWEWARDKAGITGLWFHDLRHEAVSRLVEAGLSDQEVAAISGHKTMQMLKRYTHLRAEDLVEKLDRVLPSNCADDGSNNSEFTPNSPKQKSKHKI